MQAGWASCEWESAQQQGKQAGKSRHPSSSWQQRAIPAHKQATGNTPAPHLSQPAKAAPASLHTRHRRTHLTHSRSHGFQSREAAGRPCRRQRAPKVQAVYLHVPQLLEPGCPGGRQHALRLAGVCGGHRPAGVQVGCALASHRLGAEPQQPEAGKTVGPLGRQWSDDGQLQDELL